MCMYAVKVEEMEDGEKKYTSSKIIDKNKIHIYRHNFAVLNKSTAVAVYTFFNTKKMNK